MADTQKILLFVKCPEPGKVKTRLESLRDKEWVAKLYECFVLDMLETLNGVGYARRIVFYPRDGRAEMVRLFGEGYDYQPQEGDDLGGRMKNAFLSAFSRGDDLGRPSWERCAGPARQCPAGGFLRPGKFRCDAWADRRWGVLSRRFPERGLLPCGL